MARRIDIELTSKRPDGTWTWRAAGARQPRGEVAGELVPGEAKVGDVLRAEAEFELEGIVVTALAAPKAASRVEDPGRIEVVGPRRGAPGVSVSMAPGRRRRLDHEAEGPSRRPAAGDDRARRAARPAGPSDQAHRPGSDERPGGAQEDRRRGDGRASRRPGEPARPERARPGRPEHERPERGRPRRIQPAPTYRNAALADLRPEQLPVAEQLLRGGIPALRAAIEEQNARARAEGRQQVPAEPLLAMAEELLPKLNLATWKDRATAVRDAGREAPLREVRSVVAGASAVALDDEGRALLDTLRRSLDERVKALREGWWGRITGALDGARVDEALRVASRPPEPAARLPAELAVRLAAEASAAMSPETPEERWLALLEAVVASPVRRSVKPSGLPRPPGEQLLQAARRAAGSVPELARLLGLPIPPPPGPRRPAAAGTRRG
jgi:hypothetical protein